MMIVALALLVIAAAISLPTALRNARASEIATAYDAGAGAATLTMYDGVKPAAGGAVTNEVATLTFSDPAFNAPAAGVLTADTITGDADATGGTATWFRVTDSDDNWVTDGTVGTSGADLNMNSTTISAGATVDVSSYVFTEGNA